MRHWITCQLRSDTMKDETLSTAKVLANREQQGYIWKVLLLCFKIDKLKERRGISAACIY